jgi:hypothetical protein
MADQQKDKAPLLEKVKNAFGKAIGAVRRSEIAKELARDASELIHQRLKEASQGSDAAHLDSATAREKCGELSLILSEFATVCYAQRQKVMERGHQGHGPFNVFGNWGQSRDTRFLDMAMDALSELVYRFQVSLNASQANTPNSRPVSLRQAPNPTKQEILRAAGITSEHRRSPSREQLEEAAAKLDKLYQDAIEGASRVQSDLGGALTSNSLAYYSALAEAKTLAQHIFGGYYNIHVLLWGRENHKPVPQIEMPTEPPNVVPADPQENG